MHRFILVPVVALVLAVTGASALADEDPRVSVSGEAELRLQPDMAHIAMAVSHTEQTVKAAQQS